MRCKTIGDVLRCLESREAAKIYPNLDRSLPSEAELIEAGRGDNVTSSSALPWINPARVAASASREVRERQETGIGDDRTAAEKSAAGAKARAIGMARHRGGAVARFTFGSQRAEAHAS
jgi:hypothetical protein